MKIFLCSTSYDLEDIRALTVDSFGREHEFIHFEDAAFPSRRGLHSHDQCIAAVEHADVVICIIDRRYGGRYKGGNQQDFFDQVIPIKADKKTVLANELSISWCELITAFQKGKYVITFARKRTLDEKETRRKNQSLDAFTPAYVDDNLIFDLLDWITKQPRDNWIIPFSTAVDFLAKLRKWLAVANQSLVSPSTPPSRGLAPITVIVEGSADAEIIKAIAGTLHLRRQISLVVAEGKRPLLGNLKMYIAAFKDSAGIIVLADADTSDAGELEKQQTQVAQIIADSERKDTRTIFAVPEIEAWFAVKPTRRPPPTVEQIRCLIDNPSQAAHEFTELIGALTHFDQRDDTDDAGRVS